MGMSKSSGMALVSHMHIKCGQYHSDVDFQLGGENK